MVVRAVRKCRCPSDDHRSAENFSQHGNEAGRFASWPLMDEEEVRTAEASGPSLGSVQSSAHGRHGVSSMTNPILSRLLSPDIWERPDFRTV
jgi:hypothetical protein